MAWQPPAEAFTPAPSWSPPPEALTAPKTPREIAQDYAAQITHGLGRGVAAIPGIVGDVPTAAGAGLEWAGGKVAPEMTAAVADALRPVMSAITPPTSAQTVGWAERNVIGARPQPGSPGSRVAGNIAQYLPASMIPFGGPGATGIRGLLGQGALGLTSGAASELSKEAGAPPAVQIAAGLAPGLATSAGNFLSGRTGAAGLVRQATKELSPADWQRAQEMETAAKAAGVPLMGSEALAPSVGPGAVGQLASNIAATPAGGPKIAAVFEARPAAIAAATKSTISTLGPSPSAEDVLTHTRDVALGAIQAAKSERSRATSGLFKSAAKIAVPDAAITPIVAQIDNTLTETAGGSRLANALTKLRGQLTTEGGVETNTGRLQNAYQELRDSLDNPDIVEGSLRKQAGTLAPIAGALQQALITNNPVYGHANALFARMSGPVTALAGTPDNPGLMARVASAPSNESLRRLLLDPENVSPETVSTIAQAFRNQGRPDDLRAWFQHYLENSFDVASKDVQSGANPALGANWRTLIAGSPGKRQVLDSYFAELDPSGGAARGFDRLLQVLGRTAKTPGMGSPTAARLQQAENLGGGALPTMTGLAAAGALGAAGAGAPAVGAGYLAANVTRNFMQQQFLRLGSDKIARALTDPNSVAKLRALARKDPSSPAALTSVMGLLGGRASDSEE